MTLARYAVALACAGLTGFVLYGILAGVWLGWRERPRRSS